MFSFLPVPYISYFTWSNNRHQTLQSFRQGFRLHWQKTHIFSKHGPHFVRFPLQQFCVVISGRTLSDMKCYEWLRSDMKCYECHENLYEMSWMSWEVIWNVMNDWEVILNVMNVMRIYMKCYECPEKWYEMLWMAEKWYEMLWMSWEVIWNVMNDWEVIWNVMKSR